MGSWAFLGVCGAAAAGIFSAALLIGNDYAFFAGYVVLQFIVLAQAWNILGGYAGYVNFGSAAFFAVGAYTTVFLYKALQQPPLPVLIAGGTLVAGLLGLMVGYLTLRMRGVFFAIATLALAVVLGLAESFTATFFGPSWAPAVSFGILLAALAFRPSGLLGR